MNPRKHLSGGEPVRERGAGGRLQSVRPSAGELGRRRLLVLGGAVVSGAVLAGCDVLSTDPVEQQDSGRGNERAGELEAPMLASLVEAGELPPVEERLPEDPLLVEPNDRIGVYGGTWNSAILGAADTSLINRTIGYESVMRWDPEWTTTVSNVAKSVEASDDGREFTITLRKGLKWSDGEPFTVDDVVFAYEDVLLNEELRPTPPAWLLAGDEPAQLDPIDEYRFRLIYDRPAGLFMEEMARTASGEYLVKNPRHYLEQFHSKYNKDADAVAEEEGLASWVELFLARADEPWINKEKPSLHPWIITTAVGESQRVVAERNPYYWKVDPDGRQLPYLDEVIYEVMSDEEAILLRATNGDLHFHTRHINTLPNKPVLARSREQGNYDFVTLKNSLMNEMVIEFNLTHEDRRLREVFRNKDFRIGLSHAINREEMIASVWQRQGEPWQAAPLPESEFFEEELAKQYTEYDIERANEYLDRAGLTERDDSGMRLAPDGESFTFVVEVASPAQIAFWPDAMEFVINYWKAVGIDARTRSVDRSLFTERLIANQHDAHVWEGPGGFRDEIFRPYAYFPSQAGFSHSWAKRWQEWFHSNGEDGVEPPAAPREQMELYRNLLEEPDKENRADLFRQLLEITKEQFYVIGTVMVSERYAIVRNDFHNVPSEIPESADYVTPAPTNPEQYFIE